MELTGVVGDVWRFDLVPYLFLWILFNSFILGSAPIF